MDRKEFIGVLFGALIMIIPFLLDLDYIPSAILWIMGGFAAAFIAEKGINNGILLGLLSVLIASTPVFLFFGVLALKPGGILFIALWLMLMAVFSVPGGLVGGLVNRHRFKTVEQNNLII